MVRIFTASYSREYEVLTERDGSWEDTLAPSISLKISLQIINNAHTLIMLNNDEFLLDSY